MYCVRFVTACINHNMFGFLDLENMLHVVCVQTFSTETVKWVQRKKREPISTRIANCCGSNRNFKHWRNQYSLVSTLRQFLFEFHIDCKLKRLTHHFAMRIQHNFGIKLTQTYIRFANNSITSSINTTNHRILLSKYANFGFYVTLKHTYIKRK